MEYGQGFVQNAMSRVKIMSSQVMTASVTQLLNMRKKVVSGKKKNSKQGLNHPAIQKAFADHLKFVGNLPQQQPSMKELMKGNNPPQLTKGKGNSGDPPQGKRKFNNSNGQMNGPPKKKKFRGALMKTGKEADSAERQQEGGEQIEQITEADEDEEDEPSSLINKEIVFPHPGGMKGMIQAKAKKRSKRHLQMQPIKTNARVLYNPEQDTLFVGEGNFSFVLALCDLLLSNKPEASDFGEWGEHLVATTLDDETITRQKYGNEEMSEIISKLALFGVKPKFGVDATTMANKFPQFKGQFDRVVFNFPHAGKGIKDQTRNIQTNQKLVTDFFANSIPLLKNPKKGEIHVTLKSGEPYDSWEVVKLARNQGLTLRDCIVFDPDLYPGYAHRRTLGFEEGISHDSNLEIKRKLCKTYLFKVRDREEEETLKQNRRRSKQQQLQLAAAKGKKAKAKLREIVANKGKKQHKNDDNDD